MRNLAILLLLIAPACAMAQDIPPIVVNQDPTKTVQTDWPTIINTIGHWVVEIVILVLAFLGQYRAGNATMKANEAVVQGKETKTAIDLSQVTDKANIEKQTNQLLMAKITEKPAVVVPVPSTIPPVE